MELNPSRTGPRRKPRRSNASVFIVESLSFDDESAGRMEGNILSQMLRLSGKETDYRYIRTVRELAAVLDQFDVSRRRYLHLSCHGNARALGLTLDDLPHSKLGELLRPHLTDRRLFISACGAVNARLAAAVMRRNGCRSIVGPRKDVGFDEAAVMWAAFYHVMFMENPSAMQNANIEAALLRLQSAFSLPMSYIQRSPSKPYWRQVKLDG